MFTVPELTRIRPTWAEIDLDGFEQNINTVFATLPEGSRIIAVLKADAYGHGAIELARRCRPDRVSMIATAILEEALELRAAGIEMPILVLCGPLDEGQIAAAASYGLDIGVTGPELLEPICAYAREHDVAVHLNLDTGMGRMGMIESDLPRVVEMIRCATHLRLEGIFTHFACADDPDDPLTEEQLTNFERLLGELRNAGIEAPLTHQANSAATIRGLYKPRQDVRVGLLLFGANPMSAGQTHLQPVLRWRTEIARLKTLPAGHAVGYGATFRTKRVSRIATLPVGYADGYNRLNSNSGQVLVRGQRVPVIGRVSMDLITIDVTDIPDVSVGDEVVLLGNQGSESITAEEIATRIGTIPYEVFCNISARVPRVYRDNMGTRIRSHYS